MNSFSHYMIGSYLNKYIKREYGVRLCVGRFLYWNIMADFRKPFNLLSHKTDGWKSHLKSEIEALTGQNQTQTCFSPDYSKRLGVICHFYADFFCYPHAEVYQGTFWQHIKYEWALYRFMQKSFSTLSGIDGDLTHNTCWDIRKINAIFETQQKVYLSAPPSFENDVVFTLHACLGAVTMITRATAMASAALSPT